MTQTESGIESNTVLGFFYVHKNIDISKIYVV